MLIGLIGTSCRVRDAAEFEFTAGRLARVLAELIDNIMPCHPEQPRPWIVEDHTIAPREEVTQRSLLQRIAGRVRTARNSRGILQKRCPAIVEQIEDLAFERGAR